MRIAVLCLVAACWTNGPSPQAPPPPAAPQTATLPRRRHPDTSAAAAAIAQMREFAGEMCACTDSACAQEVADEMTKWAQDQTAMGEPPKLDQAEMATATEIGEAMGRCMQQAMSPPASP